MKESLEMNFKELLIWIKNKLETNAWRHHTVNITFKKFKRNNTRMTEIIRLFVRYNKQVNIIY